MNPILPVCVALLAAAAVGQPPEALPFATLTLDCAKAAPAVRFSPDGHWLVVGYDRYRDSERKTWSYRRVHLVDLVGGLELLFEKNAFSGRDLPVFSRDSAWLAWINGFDPDDVVATRIALQQPRRSDELEVSKHPVAIGLSRRAYPTLCAIDGSRVVVHDPGAERGGERLLVYDLAAREVLCQAKEFREPSYGRSGFDVVLAWPYLLSHTRPADRASGSSYRLVLTDAREGRMRATFGSYVCRATPRYIVSRDGKRMWNGTAGFVIEEVDLPSAEASELFAARKQLYSHFLELTVAPDENLLVAWSGERKVLVCFDRVANKRFDVPVEGRAHVLGIDTRNEHVLLETKDHGVIAMQLEPPHASHSLIAGAHAFVRVAPTGEVAVTGRKVKGKLELRVWRLP